MLEAVRLWNEIYNRKSEDDIELLYIAIDIINKKIMNLENINKLNSNNFEDLAKFQNNLDSLLHNIISNIENKEYSVYDGTDGKEESIITGLNLEYDRFKNLCKTTPDTEEWNEYYGEMAAILDTILTTIVEL